MRAVPWGRSTPVPAGSGPSLRQALVDQDLAKAIAIARYDAQLAAIGILIAIDSLQAEASAVEQDDKSACGTLTQRGFRDTSWLADFRGVDVRDPNFGPLEPKCVPVHHAGRPLGAVTAPDARVVLFNDRSLRKQGHIPRHTVPRPGSADPQGRALRRELLGANSSSTTSLAADAGGVRPRTGGYCRVAFRLAEFGSGAESQTYREPSRGRVGAGTAADDPGHRRRKRPGSDILTACRPQRHSCDRAFAVRLPATPWSAQGVRGVCAGS